jgi:hypothetical protein
LIKNDSIESKIILEGSPESKEIEAQIENTSSNRKNKNSQNL